jgi:hypothetical protein
MRSLLKKTKAEMAWIIREQERELDRKQDRIRELEERDNQRVRRAIKAQPKSDEWKAIL